MHPTQPIRADAGQLAWLSGRWVGDDGDERIEETWSEPYAGMALGMFRAHRAGVPRFYELFAVEPEDGRLVMRIKHFRPGLLGWEERNESVALDLVAVRDGEAIWAQRDTVKWLVYRLEPDGAQLNVTFEVPDEAPEPGDVFRFVRG
jgi:hypothetical protein